MSLFDLFMLVMLLIGFGGAAAVGGSIIRDLLNRRPK